MKRTQYTIPVQTLVDFCDRNRASMTQAEAKHLHAVKNWLRTFEEKTTVSKAKINPKNNPNDRGIAV